MRPIVIETTKEGYPKITVDELKRIVDSAYDDGYRDGKNSIPTITTTPYTPQYPPTWTSDRSITITCETPEVRLL